MWVMIWWIFCFPYLSLILMELGPLYIFDIYWLTFLFKAELFLHPYLINFKIFSISMDVWFFFPMCNNDTFRSNPALHGLSSPSPTPYLYLASHSKHPCCQQHQHVYPSAQAYNTHVILSHHFISTTNNSKLTKERSVFPFTNEIYSQP